MRKTLFLCVFPILYFAACARSATWYVSASLPFSGDGTTWETAFKTIQEGIDAASDGDNVIVAKGVYNETIKFSGKNITVTSTHPLNRQVVADTIIDGVGGAAVRFDGTEDQTCTLSGFTIRDGTPGIAGGKSHATIQNNVITGNGENFGGGVAWFDGAIRNNVITRNYATYEGGGLFACHGLIENNVISDNRAGLMCPPPTSLRAAPTPSGEPDEIYYGGGLYRCNGVIRNNIIVRNKACEYDWGIGRAEGWGGGLAECSGLIEGNLISDNIADEGLGGGLYSCNGILRNNTIIGNSAREGGGLSSCYGTVSNCILWFNDDWGAGQIHDTAQITYSCIQDWTGGGQGNINLDPRFLDAERGDFRLRGDSPCIDAGFNDPELPETDIAGMHRIMFGGKSLTVDMGAYEFYINKVEPVFGTNETIFTWSSLADKAYSIFYSEDLFNWHTAIAAFPSFGNTTTSWLDDGSLTGLPPSLSRIRFYRLLENP